MLTDRYIKTTKDELIALGSCLHNEAKFAREFIAKKTRPESEISWFRQVLSNSIYGTFIIQNLIDNFERYKQKPEEQIRIYIGKIAIRSFLDLINVFELSTKNLVESNTEIQMRLNERIDKRIKIIENSWKSDVNRKSKDLKQNLIRDCKRKKYEMKFVRDTLFKHNIIDELDKKILEFSWDIRNSMHNNFLAIKDIEFSAPGTSLNYSFSFKKGEELYHPNDLLSFYSMTEQIIFIQLKILQFFNREWKLKAD